MYYIFNVLANFFENLLIEDDFCKKLYIAEIVPLIYMFMTFLQYLTSEFCGYGSTTGDYDNIHKYKNNQMKFLQSDLKNRCSALINQEYIY